MSSITALFSRALRKRETISIRTGIALEPLAHRVPMLLREHRGRHQHRHLPPVHHRDERCAQRYFGLAEAGVAADQAVHRLGPAHVAHDLVDRGELVGSLLEFEALGEFGVGGARMGKAWPSITSRAA